MEKYKKRENEVNGNMNLKKPFLFCILIFATFIFSLSPVFAEEDEETKYNIDFYIDSYDDDIKDNFKRYDNIYLSTPCPEETFGFTNQMHQRGTELYVRGSTYIEEDNLYKSEFKLENGTYEFCLMRGSIAQNEEKNYEYELNDVEVVNSIGSLEVEGDGEYTIYTGRDSLYSIWSVGYWDISITNLFFLVMSLIIGGTLIFIGIGRDDNSLTYIGGIAILIGLILTSVGVVVW